MTCALSASVVASVVARAVASAVVNAGVSECAGFVFMVCAFETRASVRWS